MSAEQHMLISDNLPVRKNYFDSNIVQNENARLLRRFSEDYFKVDMDRWTWTEAHVYMRCHHCMRFE